MNYIEFKAIKKLNNLYAKLKACELGFIDKYAEYYEISSELKGILNYFIENTRKIRSQSYYKMIRKLNRIQKLKNKLYFSNREDFKRIIKYQQVVKPYSDTYKT